MINLKPCPFCGGEAEIERHGTARVSCLIGCTECHASLETGEQGELCGRSWNDRTSKEVSKFKSRIAELEQENESLTMHKGYLENDLMQFKDVVRNLEERLKQQAEQFTADVNLATCDNGKLRKRVAELEKERAEFVRRIKLLYKDRVEQEGRIIELEAGRLNATEKHNIEQQAKGVEGLKFPVMLRKMWSGGEVQDFIDGAAQQLRQKAEG